MLLFQALNQMDVVYVIESVVCDRNHTEDKFCIKFKKYGYARNKGKGSGRWEK